MAALLIDFFGWGGGVPVSQGASAYKFVPAWLCRQGSGGLCSNRIFVILLIWSSDCFFFVLPVRLVGVVVIVMCFLEIELSFYRSFIFFSLSMFCTCELCSKDAWLDY